MLTNTTIVASNAVANAIASLKNLALNAAEKGDYRKAEELIGKIKNLGGDVIGLEQQVQGMRNSSIGKKVNELLDKAREAAQKGDHSGTNSFGSQAKKMAMHISMDISAQESEILLLMKAALSEKIDSAFTEGMDMARAMNAAGVNRKYGYIRNLAANIGKKEDKGLLDRIGEMFRTLKNTCRGYINTLLDTAGTLFEDNCDAQAEALVEECKSLAKAASISIDKELGKALGKKRFGETLGLKKPATSKKAPAKNAKKVDKAIEQQPETVEQQQPELVGAGA
jgi:hypothetical protein